MKLDIVFVLCHVVSHQTKKKYYSVVCDWKGYKYCICCPAWNIRYTICKNQWKRTTAASPEKTAKKVTKGSICPCDAERAPFVLLLLLLPLLLLPLLGVGVEVPGVLEAVDTTPTRSALSHAERNREEMTY